MMTDWMMASWMAQMMTDWIKMTKVLLLSYV